jgi:hypothetical protein
MILAIDPGNVESAYCFISEENYKPLNFDKVENQKLLEIIEEYKEFIDIAAIEMVASYGMPVGKTVFDTCVWIGRFVQKLKDLEVKDYKLVYRKDVKMNLCHSMKAKDSNIRQALIDRFGIVGTKKEQGFFYGFKSDIWSAYAVGITYLDKAKLGE